ncbi:hypothetical protein QL995_15160 [Pseudoalteromonas sp. APC 3358]|uniref:hypothetical protein n=1 Tax=Pseudoalteromonas sp. APC 3358 TaxID=3035176 RepID=UPI0025B292F0|nr:hypothetical protein [Pseudoalteromonas sp. APC 3358]MDN3383980.1 hypothetical protein [Pseudoalteromonas sp. APC 3358]
MLLNSQFTIHEISTSWRYDLLLPQLAIGGMQATIKQLDEIAPKIDQGVKGAASEIGNRVNKALDEFEPPKTTITEAKYNKARQGMTGDGKQMSDDWVTDKRLRKAGLNEEQIEEILESIADNDGSIEKILIRNMPDGSLSVKELNKYGNIIGTPKGF